MYVTPYLRTYVPTYLCTYVPMYLRTYVPTYLPAYVLSSLGNRTVAGSDRSRISSASFGIQII
jgi:hypothetical protein